MTKAEQLDVITKKAQILIQGISVWTSLNQKFELRNTMLEEYEKLLKEAVAIETSK